MRNTKKHAWRILLSCLALLLAFAMVLTGCDDKTPNEPAGSDTQETTGADNGGTTGGNGNNGDNGNQTPGACAHTGDFICTTCGTRLSPDGFFTGEKTATKSVTLVLDKLNVTVPSYSSTTQVTLKSLELQISLGEQNALNGFGSADCTVVETRTTGDDTDQATPTTTTTNVKALLKLESGVLYGTMDVAIAPANQGGTAFIRLSLEELLGLALDEMPADAKETFLAIMDRMPGVIEDHLLPMVEAFLAAHEDLEDVCARLADVLFTLTKDGDNYVMAFSMQKLIKLNETLNTKTLPELYDSILGTGKFAELESFANGLLEMTVSELLAELKEQGIDAEKILAMIKALLPNDEATGSVVGALTQIESMLKDQTVLSTKLKDLIFGDSETAESDVTAAKQAIAEVFTMLKGNTVYGLLEQLMNGNEDADGDMVPSPPVATYSDSAATAPGLYEQVGGVLNMLGNGIVFSQTTDANGNFISAALSVNLPDLFGQIELRVLTSYTSKVDYSKVVSKVEADENKLTVEKLLVALKDRYGDDAVVYDQATGLATITFIADHEAVQNIPGSWIKVTIVNAVEVQLQINLKEAVGYIHADDAQDQDDMYILLFQKASCTYLGEVEMNLFASGTGEPVELEPEQMEMIAEMQMTAEELFAKSGLLSLELEMDATGKLTVVGVSG